MLKWLPAPVKGVVTSAGMGVNTVILVSLLLAVSVLKMAIPLRAWRTLTSRILIQIAELWMGVNNFLQRMTQSTTWHVQGMEGLKYEGWYFVTSNHQGWCDILVLQRLFNRRIPMLKFFLKKELIWVPFLGLAWWALDFPFMRRFSKEFLKKHPDMAGKDLVATQKACEKFRHIPVSVMNFMEGTRFTREKHQAQKSPYINLLKPRAGGASFVLSSMGQQMRSMLNVTLFYPNQRTSFWDFVCGRIQHVVVQVEEVAIPLEMIQGDYENDAVFRQNFQNWINKIWQDKDNLIETLKLHYPA